MADELAALLRKLEVQACHFVGHALGGLVGLELACLNLAFTKFSAGKCVEQSKSHALRCFNIRKALLAAGRKDMYLQLQALLLFPPDWIAANAAHLAEEGRTYSTISLTRKTCSPALVPLIRSILIRVYAITHATLALANKDDTLVPWQRSQMLAEAMPTPNCRSWNTAGMHQALQTQLRLMNCCAAI